MLLATSIQISYFSYPLRATEVASCVSMERNTTLIYNTFQGQIKKHVFRRGWGGGGWEHRLSGHLPFKEAKRSGEVPHCNLQYKSTLWHY